MVLIFRDNIGSNPNYTDIRLAQMIEKAALLE